MKALILAAGRGNRMGKLTKDTPKGLLEFGGDKIIKRQIKLFRENNISDIGIVVGYKKELFDKEFEKENIKFFVNEKYSETNMVESLICALDFFDDDFIVSYSDIIFTKKLLNNILNIDQNIVVSVDCEWKDLWKVRYGTIDYDLETLDISEGLIKDIGHFASKANNIKYRYIGLLKFSIKSIKSILLIYNKKKIKKENWKASNSSFLKGSMTDFLFELISNGIDIYPSITSKQWIEFDTEKDYEVYVELLKSKIFFNIIEENKSEYEI